jgi:hypothetical protein
MKMAPRTTARRELSAAGRDDRLHALDLDDRGERGTDALLGVSRAKVNGSAEWGSLDDRHLHLRAKAALAEVAKASGVVVAHAHDPPPFARLEVSEREMEPLVDLPLARRDRCAVRVHRGLADGGGHPIDELIAGRVLQPLGLGVHEVPRVAEGVHEIRLDHAMPTYRPQRHAAPLVGELHAVVSLVLEQALIGEPAHHSTHRGRGDGEPLRDLVRARRARPALELVDRLEVVLDGCRVRVACAGRRDHEIALNSPVRGVLEPRTSSTGMSHRCRTDSATLP